MPENRTHVPKGHIVNQGDIGPRGGAKEDLQGGLFIVPRAEDGPVEVQTPSGLSILPLGHAALRANQWDQDQMPPEPAA